MLQLVLATNNNGKLREIQAMLEGFDVLSLRDIGFTDEIPEPYHTFEENALAKASTVYRFSGKHILADDSGICVPALNGAPGVDSAHYSGERDDEKNLQQLLKALTGTTDRSAYYKAVLCLIWDGEVYYFEGICNGRIIEQKSGDGGFGYDPVFIPNGYEQTFAELDLSVKNSISHRGKAMRLLVDFLAQEAAAADA